MTGVTSSGFEYDIDGKAIHDFRFLMALRDLQSTDVGRQVNGTANLISIVFNDPKEENRFLDHVSRDGRALTEDVMKELREIIDAMRTQDETVKN